MTTTYPPPARASAPPPSRGRAVRRGRVLVVDDEPVIGTVLQRALGKLHDVTVVEHGRDAISLVDGGADFDVVLCDVVMPDVSGPQIYEALRERHPRFTERFVFITGGCLHEKARSFLATIANPVLTKPFELGPLREIVRRLVSRAV
jgi:two-component system, cell cycle sensor histidine kinase and response regulator CckA